MLAPDRPPARIDTDRVTIRCYRPEDVTAMSEVIPANYDHLARFMPWARAEPISHDDRVKVVRTFIDTFEAGTDFTYGIFDAATGEYLGGTGLHPRLEPGEIEIGYGIRLDRQGQGLITEAVQALCAAAFAMPHIDRVVVRHLPENTRSGAVPRRAGFTYDGRRSTAMPGVEGEQIADFWVAERAEADGIAGVAP